MYLPTYIHYLHVHAYIPTCSYMYIHVRTCTYIHTYMYTHVNTCKYMYIHVHTYIHTCTYMYIHVHTCTYMYKHVQTCTNMYIHTYTVAHTQTHIHIYMCVYVCMHVCMHACMHVCMQQRYFTTTKWPSTSPTTCSTFAVFCSHDLLWPQLRQEQSRHTVLRSSRRCIVLQVVRVIDVGATVACSRSRGRVKSETGTLETLQVPERT